MARSLSHVRLIAVLVAVVALAGALPATRSASLAQDVPLETEESIVSDALPAEESSPPEGEAESTEVPAAGPAGVAPPSDEPPADEPPAEEPPVAEPSSAPAPDTTDDGTTADAGLVTDATEETTESDDAPVAAGFTAQQTVEVTLLKTDDEENPLGAACFAVYEELPGGAFGDFVFSTCTNELGQIIFNLAPGDYILVEEEAPDGFLAIDNVSFTVESDTALTLGPFTDLPGGGNGTLEILKEDDEGSGVDGACFELYQDLDPDAGQLRRGALVFSYCDETTGAFVISRFQAPGDYILVESSTPPGYVTADDIELTVTSGQTTSVTMINVPAQGNEPGSVIVAKRDTFQNLLLGACFELFNDTDDDEGEFAKQVGVETS